jgi:hypothetical protein
MHCHNHLKTMQTYDYFKVRGRFSDKDQMEVVMRHLTKSLSVLSSIAILAGISACGSMSPKIGSVNGGGGDTKVETVDVGTVSGGGTTQVDTVNANISLDSVLGYPYTIVKTVSPVPCANEQACSCQVDGSGLLGAKGNKYYVAKINPSKTIFACLMSTKTLKNAAKSQVKIISATGAIVQGSPIGGAKNLEEVNSIVK